MSIYRTMLWGVLILAPFAALAGTPEADFDALFGKEAKQVAASPDTKASADFAAKLLAAVKTVEDQKDLQALLLEKAHEFGIKDPAGYSTALEAMQQLSLLVPSKAAQCQAKMLIIRQLKFNRATGDQKKEAGEDLLNSLMTLAGQEEQAGKVEDALKLLRRALDTATTMKSDRKVEIGERMKSLAANQQARAEFEALKTKLNENPKSIATRKALVVGYLGEFFNPEEARKLLTDDLDAKFRELAGLAMQKREDLKEEQLTALGDWYAELGDKATPTAQWIFYGNARACCNRYLELHTAKDAGRLKVTMLLDRLEKSLAKTTAKESVPAAPVPGPEKSKPLFGKEASLDLGSGVKLKLVLIPAGRFTMGSTDRESSCVGFPPHAVTISKPFYIGIYSVTQGQWKAVMETEPWNERARDKVLANADCPAVCVTWIEAVEFSKKLSQQVRKPVRLPTESEWEYACRAGTTTRLCYGNDPGYRQLGDYAWYRSNAYDINERYAHPVGQKKPNDWGLYDVHGNISQWCQDWYDAKYYANSPNKDPQGPDTGTQRVVRGGSWFNVSHMCRSDIHFGGDPNAWNTQWGFRIVVSTDVKETAAATNKPPEQPLDKPAEKPGTITGKEAVLKLDGGVKLKLALIPAGKFMMGTDAGDAGHRGNQGPKHEVTISKPFYMSIYLVTQAQWRAVMVKGRDQPPWSGKPTVKEDADNPAVYVSWEMADDFCGQLSKDARTTVRLPTEAEWEYACRAGTATRYYFGDDESLLGDYAWYKNNAVDVNEMYAHRVGQKKPNAWGLYDMHGNVLQWCQDYYEPNYDASASQTDPAGPASGTQRVRRGGGWYFDAWKCTSAYRSMSPQAATDSFLGFRVVVPADGK